MKTLVQHSEAGGGLRRLEGAGSGCSLSEQGTAFGKPSGCTDRSSNKQETLLGRSTSFQALPRYEGITSPTL